jgi:hypothetical protein
MRTLVALLVCSIALSAAPVQQGHPLSGTWAGNWGPNATQRTHLTFVLNWDGNKVSGTINPGPDAIELTSVNVDVTNWTVRFEGQTASKVRVTAEGRIEDLGSIHRTISGTWRQGDATGDFKIRRD